MQHSIRVTRHLYSKRSEYQQIDILETPEFGRVLTLDGNVMLTERDEFIYDEMITHVPMAVHTGIQDVLVIGAGDGGVVRELTRYDRVERIDLVEMDPMVVEACRTYLPSNACRMDDRRVHIHFENALKFIRRCEAEYDLIIVDSTDPFGPSEGLFTREFYGNCYNALREDGIMVNQQGSPFYAEDAKAMQRSHKRIVSTFPISRVYQAHIPTYAAGYWLFGFASKKYHPIDDLDAEAWSAEPAHALLHHAPARRAPSTCPRFWRRCCEEVEEMMLPEHRDLHRLRQRLRARADRALRRPLRLHHQLPARRPVRPLGHAARELRPGDLQPLPGRGPDDCAVFDSGDLELCFGSAEMALADIEARAEEILRDGKFPLLLGGEHLVTLGAVRRRGGGTRTCTSSTSTPTPTCGTTTWAHSSATPASSGAATTSWATGASTSSASAAGSGRSSASPRRTRTCTPFPLTALRRPWRR